MKYSALLLIFLFINSIVAAQIQLFLVEKGCAYIDTLKEKDIYLFDSSQEAEIIVEEIVNALGLTKNFVVKAANIPNAHAISSGNIRYILYSIEFLEKFKADAQTRWAAYSVLAHEIGHHLNYNNFDEKDSNKRKIIELEADRFSGSILRVLGASLKEAQACIELFVLQGETNTHPSASARKAAIANGWKMQDELLKSHNPAWLDLEALRRDSLISEAKKWFERGERERNQERKISLYAKAIALDTTFFSAYMNRGVALFEEENYYNAKEDFVKAILLRPYETDIYWRIAESNYHLGNFKESIEYYEKSIEIDSNDILPYFEIGRIKEEMGESAEAIKYFEKCIQIEPNNFNAYLERGKAKSSLNNYEEAFNDFNFVISKASEKDEAYYLKGVLNYRLQRFQEVLLDFNKSIELNSIPGISKIYKGMTEYKLGNYKEAIQDYDFYLIMPEENASFVYIQRSQANEALGKIQEAVIDLDKAILGDSLSSYLYNRRGFLKNKLNKWEDAIKDFDRAIQLDPNEPYAYNNRGKAKSELGKLYEGLLDVEKSLQLDASNAWAFGNKGCILTSLGRYAEAHDNLEKALKIDPSLAWVQGCKDKLSKILKK